MEKASNFSRRTQCLALFKKMKKEGIHKKLLRKVKIAITKPHLIKYKLFRKRRSWSEKGEGIG